MSDADILAHVLAGEGSVCGFWAMVGIAYAYTTGRAGPFYGWQTPTDMATFVSRWWFLYPDPTPAARFFVSREDLQKASVRAFTLDRGPPLAVWECAGNLALYAFA